MATEQEKWDKDHKDGGHGCHNMHILQQLVIKVLKYRAKVYCIRRCEEANTKAAKQIALEVHLIWAGLGYLWIE